MTDKGIRPYMCSVCGAASLSERFGVSRQHIYKVRAGKQVPWRTVIGPIHPDDRS